MRSLITPLLSSKILIVAQISIIRGDLRPLEDYEFPDCGIARNVGNVAT